MPKGQKYLAFFILAIKHALRNYKAMIGLSIFLITCLLIFAHLWKVVATNAGVNHINPNQLLWYIAFNEWVLISLPDVPDEIEEDLRSGRLAYLLPRPISYLGAVFAEAFGTYCANLFVLGIVTFLFAWMTVGSLPFHPVGFAVAIPLGLLAGCVCIIFYMVIGLSGFWLQEVSPFYWVWEKLLFMFGGLILPLAAYPQWLQTIAYFTPFPSILGERSALALNFTTSHIVYLTLSLLGWGTFGLLCVVLLYRRGLRIVNIEGG